LGLALGNSNGKPDRGQRLLRLSTPPPIQKTNRPTCSACYHVAVPAVGRCRHDMGLKGSIRQARKWHHCRSPSTLDSPKSSARILLVCGFPKQMGTVASMPPSGGNKRTRKLRFNSKFRNTSTIDWLDRPVFALRSLGVRRVL